MSTRNISRGIEVTGARTENLITIVCRISLNLRAPTAWNPQGLPGIGGMILNTLSTKKFVNDWPGFETGLEAGE
jgi:hypothetical protein